MARSRPSKTSPAKKAGKTSSGKKSAYRSPASSRASASKHNDDQIVVNSPRLAVWQFNIKNHKVKWSSSSAAFFGLKRNAKMPGTIADLVKWIHKDDRKIFRDLFKKSVRSHSAFVAQARVVAMDKNYRWMEFTADPVSNSSKITDYAGVIQDITLQKITEYELQDWKTRNELISESAGLIIYDYDVASGEIFWSGNTMQLVGYTPVEMGRIELWEQLIHPHDRDEANRVLELSRANLTPYDVYYRFRKKNGGYKHMHDRGMFVADATGQAVRMLGILNDVSERIKSEHIIHQSEKSYRELFNSVGEAIYIHKLDGTIIDVNKGACELSGYSKEEFVGRTPGFLAAPGQNDFTDVRSKFADAHKGAPQTFRWWGKKKTGEVLIQEINLRRGTYFGEDVIIATAWDITEKIEAEQTLKESELRFRTLQEASWGGIGIHDKGLIIDCNQGLSDITGYSYEELKGSNGLNLIAPEFRDQVLQKILARSQEPYDVEGIRKDGSRYFLEIHAKNIPFKDGSIRVTEFRDITDRKASESKILEQNARLITTTDDLKFRNEQLQEFAQIVSHNLRSPVGSILSLLNFIENAESAEERFEYLNLIKEAGTTTLSTLQELNEVLQIKENQGIVKQKLDFAQVYAQVRRMLVARIVEADAEITTDFSEAPFIHYPNIYLESIFLNLLSNALRYVVPGRKPAIVIRTFKRDGGTWLSIQDNGLGINMQRYGHQIFKLRKTFHKHPESRGIGLFMIKNQIEAMGGDISVSSVENEGTTFFVNFDRRNPKT